MEAKHNWISVYSNNTHPFLLCIKKNKIVAIYLENYWAVKSNRKKCLWEAICRETEIKWLLDLQDFSMFLLSFLLCFIVPASSFIRYLFNFFDVLSYFVFSGNTFLVKKYSCGFLFLKNSGSNAVKPHFCTMEYELILFLLANINLNKVILLFSNLKKI